jgi:hypothetical protein
LKRLCIQLVAHEGEELAGGMGSNGSGFGLRRPAPLGEHSGEPPLPGNLGCGVAFLRGSFDSPIGLLEKPFRKKMRDFF